MKKLVLLFATILITRANTCDDDDDEEEEEEEDTVGVVVFYILVLPVAVDHLSVKIIK